MSAGRALLLVPAAFVHRRRAAPATDALRALKPAHAPLRSEQKAAEPAIG